jgi:prefoldin subunit 5
MATRVITRELDERLHSVEEKLAEMAERIGRIGEEVRRNHPVELVDEISPIAHNHTANGNGKVFASSGEGGKIADIEAQIMRLNDRIQKIASSIIAQASRY